MLGDDPALFNLCCDWLWWRNSTTARSGLVFMKCSLHLCLGWERSKAWAHSRVDTGLRQQGCQHPRELSVWWAERFCSVGRGRQPWEKHLSGNGSVVRSGCSGAGCCLRTRRFCYWVRTGALQRCTDSECDHFMVTCVLKSSLKYSFVNMRNAILF